MTVVPTGIHRTWSQGRPDEWKLQVEIRFLELRTRHQAVESRLALEIVSTNVGVGVPARSCPSG